MSLNYYFQPIDLVDQTHLQMSEVSLYSTTPWREANFISRIIMNFYEGQTPLLTPVSKEGLTLTDATANVGGNTISFYLSGIKWINAVELNPTTCQMLSNNLQTYHLPTDRVHCCDYLSLYKDLLQDVVFLDPPWGGQDYMKNPVLDLSLSGVDLSEICWTLFTDHKASLVVLKLPLNYNLPNLLSVLQTRSSLTHNIYRGSHHSYNIVFFW